MLNLEASWCCAGPSVYHQGILFENNLRGDLTFNKSATQQNTFPLLAAWRIKQCISDNIHPGWVDLTSPIVRSNQAMQGPVRTHLRLGDLLRAFCHGFFSYLPASGCVSKMGCFAVHIKAKPSQRSNCCVRSVMVYKLTEGHCVVLLASRVGWS